MRWQLALVFILMLSSACRSTTTHYAAKDLLSPSAISAIMTRGIAKPGCKPFPLYRKPGLFAEGHTEHDGHTTFMYVLIGWPLDLIATLGTPFCGYKTFDDVVLKGELRGQLQATGEVPDQIPIWLTIGDAIPRIVTVAANGNLSVYLDMAFNLKNTTSPFPMPIILTVAGKEELAAKGVALKSTPDTIHYSLALKNDNLELRDSSGASVHSLNLDVSFKEVRDERRIKELEYQGQERRKELAQREKAKKRAAEKVGSLVESFRQRIRDNIIAATGQRYLIMMKGYESEWLADDFSRVRVWGNAEIRIGGVFTGYNRKVPWSFTAWDEGGAGWQIQDTTQYGW